MSGFDLTSLAGVRTIEMTTTGRNTGELRRTEIWWFHIDGRFVITGTPGPRDWLANVLAKPDVVLHVAGQDIPARLVPVEDAGFRQRAFTHPDTSWYRTQEELDRLVATAPMVEVFLQG